MPPLPPDHQHQYTPQIPIEADNGLDYTFPEMVHVTTDLDPRGVRVKLIRADEAEVSIPMNMESAELLRDEMNHALANADGYELLVLPVEDVKHDDLLWDLNMAEVRYKLHLGATSEYMLSGEKFLLYLREGQSLTVARRIT